MNTQADRARYDLLQACVELCNAIGLSLDSEYVQAYWRESEDIKNRHGGMPPSEGGAA